MAINEAPQHESAWATGAAGEEQVARSLAKRLNDTCIVLHDRRIPGSRANIDHIAIAPSGVWVIDAKRYKGKVAVEKPLFGKAKLSVAGRDRSKLAQGLTAQVELVQAALPAELSAEPTVRGALCFIDADLPLMGTLSFGGHLLLHPRALAKRINKPGTLDPEQVERLGRSLAVSFPAA